MFTTPNQQFTIPNAAIFDTPEQSQQVHQKHMSLVEDSPQSTKSNRSAKPEHHTALFTNQFLKATYFSLEKHLIREAWFKKPRKLGVLHYPQSSLLTPM